MRTDAFGAKRVTSRDYSRFWAQSPGWQPGRKGAVRGLLQVEEWHVRALQGCILGMPFFLHGDILSQIVLPPDFLGRFMEVAKVVNTACLDVGGATGVNQAFRGVVKLAGRQVQGHARKDAAVVVEVGDVDVGLSGGAEGAMVIHVAGNVQLQVVACGDALSAAEAANVDFCPFGTGDGARAVKAVGGDVGLAGKDVAI